MTDYVQCFIEEASQVSELDELGAAFYRALSRMGFTEWSYQIVSNSPSIEEDPIILSTFPEEWVEHYVNCEYTDVDPLVEQTPKAFTPFKWSDLVDLESLSEKQKGYWKEATDYGLGEGVGIPIHGYGGRLAVVTLVSRDMQNKELAKLFDHYKDQIHVLSLVYNSYAKDMLHENRRKQSITAPLTGREKECMIWVAKGKSSWDIAQILNVSEHTIIFHVENAKKKFGVKSRQEAVVKAVLNGFINP